MSTFYDWVPRAELQQWLELNHPALVDQDYRATLIHPIDQRFVSPLGDGRGRYEATYRVLRFDGSEFCTYRFHNLASESGKAFEDVFEDSITRVRSSLDKEGVFLINMARYHMLKIINAMMIIDTYEPRKQPWYQSPKYSSLVSTYASKYFKSLLSEIYAARKSKKHFKDDIYETKWRRFKKLFKRKQEQVISPEVAAMQLPGLKINKKGEIDADPPSMIFDAFPTAGKYDQSWVGETPCFRVVNSNVKFVAGYARIQVGGKSTGKDGIKYFHEDTIGELSHKLRNYAVKLKDSGVNNVLLSGSIYGPDSKLSPHILNAVLPKCFDGMNVKIVGNAKYSRKIASRVREFLALPEHIDPDEDYRDCYTGVFVEPTKLWVPDDMDRDMIGLPLTKCVDHEADLTVLQTVYDAAFPESTTVDTYQKALHFHLTPFDTAMPEINARGTTAEFCDEKIMDPPKYMEPVLRTHLEQRHPVNQQELLYSVFNRNYMPPKDNALISSVEAAKDLFESFKSLLKEEPEKVKVSDMDISAYIDKKGEVMAQEVAQLLQKPMEAPDRWNALVKGTAKPVLTDVNADVMSPTQVIVHKDKLYNALLGPYLGQIKDEVIRLLDDKVFIYSDAAGDQLELRLTRNLDKIIGKDVNEADIGKYDKSQGFTSFFFEVMVFKYFGLPDTLLWLWIDSHWFANIKSMVGTTSFQLPPQRKSGDPWTYSGNTFYLMAILNKLYAKSYTYMMVSGDDSLIFGDFDEERSKYICDVMSRDYNLDVKMVKADSLYFCSRFMLIVHDRVYLVPDPVKFLVKIGKKDVRDYGHLEDIRISLCDQIESYQYVEIQLEMERVIHDRYDIMMAALIMQHMFALVTCKESFRAAFMSNVYSERVAIVCPTDSIKQKSRSYVVHRDLIRRQGRYKSLDEPQKAEYMRSVAKNAGRRVLITESEDYVPMGTQVIARMDVYNHDAIKDLVNYHYRA